MIKKVLIAEDDALSASVLEALFEEAGVETLLAHDGLQAGRLAKETRVDVIVMDIHMPYFNGVEAIRLLRAQNIHTPIVAVSASSALQEREQALQAGATIFLKKPIARGDFDRILQLVRGQTA